MFKIQVARKLSSHVSVVLDPAEFAEEFGKFLVAPTDPTFPFVEDAEWMCEWIRSFYPAEWDQEFEIEVVDEFGDRVRGPFQHKETADV